MSIVWREAMSVGDKQIDDDHKHLVTLINAFETAIEGKIDYKRVVRILLGLAEYTAEHFHREEEAQIRIGYPYHDTHRESHRSVLRKLRAIVDEFAEAHNDHDRDRLIRGLIGFLREWLIDHIIQSDLRMRPYFAKWHAEQAELEKRRAIEAQHERRRRTLEALGR